MAEKKKAVGVVNAAKSAAKLVGGIAAAAGAAGYYFYKGEAGASDRRIVKRWAQEFKKDVIVKAKKVDAFDKKVAAKIVDEASAAYKQAKNVDKKDLQKAAGELKKHWEKVAKDAKVMTVAAKKAAEKQAKKAQAVAQKTVVDMGKKKPAPKKK